MIRKTTLLTVHLLFLVAGSYAQSPTANFSVATTSGCSPLVVDFNDQSTGNPTSWFWDFGNGATSTLQNPSTTYFKEGMYTVKLTVKNAFGSNTLSRPSLITVIGKPVPAFGVNDSAGCYPLRAQFTDLSTASAGTSNTTWFWDFVDGTQSTLQNPLHAYTTSGSFAVTIKITNDKGCYNVLTKPSYINVTDGVRAGFTNTQAAVCKPPFSLTFNSSSTGSGTLSYLWDFGDGSSSTIANPTHNYTATGNFSVSLAVTSSNGCSDTLTKPGLLNTQDIHSDFSAPDSICTKDSVHFLNTSTPVPQGSQWFFGDGSNSKDTLPVKAYSLPGNYTVTLYNQYSYCRDSVSKKIRVLPLPVARFQPDQNFKCSPPFTVQFQDQSSGGASWQWQFGDSTTSTLQHPSHTYTNFGFYTVKLVVTNASGCTDTLQMDSLIKIIKPLISVPILPARGCLPFTLQPVASITTLDNVNSYLWDFGDGATSTLARPSHTYTVQGTYTVTLTITTSTGCTEVFTLPQAVRVGTVPLVNFTVTPPVACAYQQVQFTNGTNISDAWSWDFGDGTHSNLENPLHAYVDTGYFNVTLIATNNGCDAKLTLPRVVRSKPPVADFLFSANCNNRLQFNFKDNSKGAQSWFWNFGDGTTSTQQNPVHTFPSYKSYTVSLTVVNDTCSNTASQTIKVFDEQPGFNASLTTACRQTTIYFSALVKDPTNFVHYLWDFGDGGKWDSDDFGKTGSAYHFYATAGTFDVRLTTRDIYGCPQVVTKPAYIRINGPTAAFSATNTSGCKGLTTLFKDLSTTDGINKILQWKWDFGDGTSKIFTAPPFTHVYADTGTYSVSLVVTDASGCRDSIFQPGLIHTTRPLASFSVDTLTCPGSALRFTNTSMGQNISSSWSLGDGSTDTATTVSHAYADTGRYSIQLRISDRYGCTDTLNRPAYIRVARPLARFTVSDSISSCAPFEVDFTNTSYYTNSQLWDLGGGSTSSLPNPVRYYITPGTYQVRLAVTSPGGCRDTAYKTIMLYDTIGSRVLYAPLNGCKPLSVDLNTFSKGPVTYTWDFGDGTLLTNKQDTVNHIYNFFGNFVPKVIMTDPSGCEFPITGSDTIFIIGATAKFGLDKKFFCDSGWVNITDSTTYNDSLTSYNWSFGDGSTTSVHAPGPHQYTAPGFYTVSLNVETENHCVDTFTLKDVIKIVQSPLIHIEGDSVICVYDFMNHRGVFDRTDTSQVQWLWQLPNGQAPQVQNPPSQQYTSPGNFVVTAMAINSSGCRDTATKNILIHPLPVVTMPATLIKTAGFPITIPATYSSNVTSYNWLPAETLSCPDCPQPTTTTKFSTRYTVSFVDSNGCRNTGQIQVIVVCPNANVFVPNTFSPNGDGSNDVFYVRGRGLERVKSLRVFNRWGEVVFEKSNFPVNDPLYGWDGRYKGNKPHPDVYVYQLEVFCENSDIIRFEGNVALIQ
ncbi:MAG: PKD domain-containing protein [Flavisolibacter sp.]